MRLVTPAAQGFDLAKNVLQRRDEQGRPPTGCVVVAWYDVGALIGPTTYTNTWNPWYLREVVPGVYVYAGMK